MLEYLHSAVWLNLLIIFLSMGFIAHSAPNFVSAKLSFGVDPGPVHTAAFVSLPLFSKVNGVMQMVFAYGGAMIFPEFMAEMRRPMDFWKAMVYFATSMYFILVTDCDIPVTVLCSTTHCCCVYDVRHICLHVPRPVHSSTGVPRR